MVSGLPPTGSWQDVKDHFREAGDIIFADVFRDGTGVVEFSRQEHARRALRDLDDSKFRSHEVSLFFVNVINSLFFLTTSLVRCQVSLVSFLFNTGRNCLYTCKGSTGRPVQSFKVQVPFSFQGEVQVSFPFSLKCCLLK